ncbi:hypothetical protein AVEN_273936-1, partial [Araneus ventricosus]
CSADRRNFASDFCGDPVTNIAAAIDPTFNCSHSPTVSSPVSRLSSPATPLSSPVTGEMVTLLSCSINLQAEIWGLFNPAISLLLTL